MNTYQVNDIFYSIQGEGYWAGVPMVFVRFSGCNLECWFCDTDHSKFVTYTEDELFELIMEQCNYYNCNRICFTGGEPLLQLDWEFVKKLLCNGMVSHIETNGTIPIPEWKTNNIWLTVSPKHPMAQFNLICGDELKFVYQGESEMFLTELVQGIYFDHYFLQPAVNDDSMFSKENLNQAINIVKKNKGWRLSVQLHKLLGIK